MQNQYSGSMSGDCLDVHEGTTGALTLPTLTSKWRYILVRISSGRTVRNRSCRFSNFPVAAFGGSRFCEFHLSLFQRWCAWAMNCLRTLFDHASYDAAYVADRECGDNGKIPKPLFSDRIRDLEGYVHRRGKVLILELLYFEGCTSTSIRTVEEPLDFWTPPRNPARGRIDAKPLVSRCAPTSRAVASVVEA